MPLITAISKKSRYRVPKLDWGGPGTPARDNFLKNLPRRMKAMSVTDSELARRVGVAPISVGRWKSGASEPNFNTLDKIAKALDTTVVALIGSPEEMGYFDAEITEEVFEALKVIESAMSRAKPKRDS